MGTPKKFEYGIDLTSWAIPLFVGWEKDWFFGVRFLCFYFNYNIDGE